MASGAVGLESVAVLGDRMFWSERRPEEGGRVAIVRSVGSDSFEEVLPSGFAARSRVHEYGGAAWWLGRSHLYFVNWDDQRVYRVGIDGGEPEPVSPEPVERHEWRFADGVETADGSLICVREDHSPLAQKTVAGEVNVGEARNEIVSMPSTGGGEIVVLATGSDFVAAPRVSPDGRWLSWLRWNHPQMPWDGTELCAAPIFDGPRLGNVHVVAGNPNESIIHPNWHSDGRLIFGSDSNGFWNLRCWLPGTQTVADLTSFTNAEVGGPPWVLGGQAWREASDGSLVAIVTRDAVDELVLIKADGSQSAIRSNYTAFSSLTATKEGTAIAICSSATAMPDITEFHLATGANRVRRQGEDLGLAKGWFSEPETFDFVSANERPSHAFFYPPAGELLSGADGELPPLIVVGHGGPTAHSSPQLSLKINYWTSRGFAVADVNYGGSSGYGRAYRQLLQGNWGIVDVEDCVAAAQQLAAAGKVDPDRCAIRGSSAGGLTVLLALATSDTFSAGASLYGVAELEALATDTHKFEARYLDGLIGRYPEDKAIYEARSPINHASKISAPLLVMQGLDDEVVPPSQSEAIVAAVAANGLPHAAIYFEGEQHGFRKAETLVRSFEAELWFYGRVLGFSPADVIAPVEGAVGLQRSF